MDTVLSCTKIDVSSWAEQMTLTFVAMVSKHNLFSLLELFVDVWMTSEGQNWTRLKSSALWSPRWQHDAVVHRQMIYLLGGWGDEYLNDGLVTLFLAFHSLVLSLGKQRWRRLGIDLP
jgi:hypothetical protein